MSTDFTATNMHAALELTEAKIPIFPALIVWNCAKNRLDKRPAITGWQAASPSPHDVKAWWKQFPKAVPGIPLGRAGLVVLDPDLHPGAPDGVHAFRELQNAHRIDPTPVTITPSNGFHFYFGQPAGEPLGNNRGDLPPGICVRGAGGFVVAPGSICDRGSWRTAPNTPPLIKAFREQTIPVLPAWLAEIIRPPREHQQPGACSSGGWTPHNDDDRRVRDALQRINSDDRETWLQIGMALKDEYGDAGRALWDAWSQRSNKYDAADQDKIWHSFRRDGISIGTLFWYAKKAGWNPEERQAAP